MNKMTLTPTAGAARPASAELMSPLGSARGAQDNEASAAFARLLQTQGGKQAAAPSTQAARGPALLSGPSASPATAVTPAASPAPRAAPGAQAGAAGASASNAASRSTAAESSRNAAVDQARRQEAAKAAGRRGTEAQAKDRQGQGTDGAQGIDAAEDQDPVLAQVLRHLRHGDSRADAELESTEDAGTDPDDPRADGSTQPPPPQLQALVQDPRQALPPASDGAGAADHTQAAGSPARLSAEAIAQGDSEATARRPGVDAKAAESAGDALPLAAQGRPDAFAAQDRPARADSPELAIEAAGHRVSSAENPVADKPAPAGAFAGLLQQVQTSVVQDKAASTGLPGARYEIESPLHAKGFAPEMAARLSLAATEGVQQAQLHLNPAEMGPVQVQIVLDGQQAQISFVAEQADTRAVLEKSLPDLAGALREQGLTLSGGGVFSQQQQTPSDPSGQAQHDGSAAGSRWASSRQDAGAAEEAALAQQAAPVGTRSRGVLDLFA